MRVRTAVSAGGVIVDDDGNVALTQRKSFKGNLQWGLPKGTVERGETNEEAAMRECNEETGLEVELVAPIKTIDYWYVEPARGSASAARVHKYVHYFLMKATGGDPTKHDHETEAVALVPFPEALAMASFRSERDVIAAAEALLGS